MFTFVPVQEAVVVAKLEAAMEEVAAKKEDPNVCHLQTEEE